MSRKLSIPLFILFIIALYVSLNKVVIPFVIDIASSDLFLEESDDLGDMLPISNDKTKMAFLHCNNEIRKEFDDSVTLQFADNPENVWNTGNATFLVNAYVGIINPKEGTSRKKYVCSIRYEGGDDTDFENWSLYGLQI
ncbi:MAG: hypothetical protein ABFS02_05790 [Pseudomonadota bacterium]